MPGTGGSRVILGVGFWAQSFNYVLVPSPFNQTDWLLSSRPPQTAKSSDPPNLLLSTLAAPPVVDNTKIFRAPVFARFPDRLPAARQEYVANLLPFQSMAPTGVPPAPTVDQPVGGQRPKAIVDPVIPISSLLTPNPPQPFRQSDWLRQPALPKAIGEVLGTLSPLLTPNPSTPFSQRDWFQIAPRQKAKVDDPLNLTPFLPAPVVTVQFSQLDWPRPRDPQQKAQPTDQQNLLTSTLATVVPVLNVIFRSPLIARLPDAWPKAKVDDARNLTIQLPVVVITVAFKQLDWPNAALPRVKQADASVAASAPLYSPNPAQPFIQDLWDLATRSYPKAIGEAVGTLSPILTPNPRQPFVQYEWRSAARVPLSLKSDSFWGALPLYAPNPSAPFNQDLWENAARAWAKTIGEVAGTLSPLLTPNPTQPFSQSDWTRIPKSPAAIVDAFVNLLPFQGIPVVFAPFYQNDWLSATLARAPQKSDVYGGPNTLLTPNPTQPFASGLWDSATRAWGKAVGEPIGRVAPLLTPNPSRPFSQSDWPSAIAAKPPAKVDTVSLLLPVYSPQRPFSSQTETRTFAYQIVKSDIHVNLLPLHTPPPVPLPFRQGDWPLPHSAGQIDRSFTFRSQFIPPFVPPIAAQYFLLQPHYINDTYLQAWTTVTEGIEIPFGWIPTLMVDPLNQQAVNAFYAAGPRTGYPGPGYDWQGWQYLTPQRQAAIQSPRTFWKQTSPGMFSLTGLGSGLPPVGV